MFFCLQTFHLLIYQNIKFFTLTLISDNLKLCLEDNDKPLLCWNWYSCLFCPPEIHGPSTWPVWRCVPCLSYIWHIGHDTFGHYCLHRGGVRVQVCRPLSGMCHHLHIVHLHWHLCCQSWTQFRVSISVYICDYCWDDVMLL